MRVVFDREQLLRVFGLVSSVASGKTKEILANVKLVADGDGVMLSATDAEMWLMAPVDGCDVSHPGKTLLPVQRVGAILKESSDEQVTMEVGGSHLKISGATWNFDLPSINPDEYPSVRGFDGDGMFAAESANLREGLRRTSFAVDVASSRFALGGVRLEFGDGFNLVATDGRRLSHVVIQGESAGAGTTSYVILPERSCRILERSLPDKGDVRIILGDEAVFSFGGVVFGSRLVEGRFPSWRQVIPGTDGWMYVELPVGPFGSAVRQAAIVADKETRGLDFAFSPGQVTIGVRTAELGQSAITMPVGGIEEDVTLRLDHRFVRDFLQCFDPGEMVSLHYKSATQPTLWESGGYRYVVMPMALE